MDARIKPAHDDTILICLVTSLVWLNSKDIANSVKDTCAADASEYEGSLFSECINEVGASPNKKFFLATTNFLGSDEVDRNNPFQTHGCIRSDN